MPESNSQFTSRIRVAIGSFLAGSVVTFSICLVVWKTSIETDGAGSVVADVSMSSPNIGRTDTLPRSESTGEFRQGEPRPGSLSEILQLKSAFSQTTALHGLIEHFDADQLDRVLVQLERDANPAYRFAFKVAVYHRYVEVDPIRALDGLQDRNNDPDASGLLNYAMAAWARFDFDAAAEYARQSDASARQQLAQSILAARTDLSVTLQTEFAEEFQIETFGSAHLVRMAQTDPESAWHEALATSKSGPERQVILSQIARLWADREPETAIDAISETLESSNLRHSMLGEVISQLAKSDPEAAVALALNRPVSRDREVMLERAFVQWGEISPEDALAAASSVRPPELSEKLTESVYGGWARQDPHAILDMHASIPESIRKDVLEQAMYQIVREDPDSVLSLAADLLNLNDAMRPSGAVMMALQSLSENDLQLAMNWIDDNVKGPAKTSYVASTLMHTAHSDPEKAFNFALTMPETTGPSPEFNILMGMIFSDGAESAKKFVPQIRGELWRNTAFSTLGSQLVSSDSAEALAYGRSLDEDVQPQYYQSVFSRWAELDLDEAASKISRVPSGVGRDRALSSLVMSSNAMERSEAWVRRHYDRISDRAVRSQTAAFLAHHYTKTDKTALAEKYQKDIDPNLAGEHRLGTITGTSVIIRSED